MGSGLAKSILSFNSSSFSCWYFRPKISTQKHVTYKNITLKDVSLCQLGFATSEDKNWPAQLKKPAIAEEEIRCIFDDN